MKTFNKTKLFLLVGFFCLLSMNSMAAQRDSCEDGGVGGCYDDMLDQQDNMINEVDDLLDSIDDAGVFSLIRVQTGTDVKSDLKDRIEGVRREHGRAKEVNDATSDEEYDAMLLQGDKETGKHCKSSDKTFSDSLDGSLPPGYTEVDGNFGNGKCDVFSATDDEGNIVSVNERKENMCEKVCVDKKNSNEESRSGESKGRLLGRMNESISSGRKASLNISVQTAKVRELGVLFSEFQASEIITEDADVCAVSDGDALKKVTAEDIMQGVITGLDGVTIATDAIADGLEVVKDLLNPACEQDVAGFNGSTACIPFVAAYHISNVLTNILKNSVTVLGDAKEHVALAAGKADAQDALDAKACTKQVRDEFKAGGAVVELQGGVSSLQSDVNSLRTAGGNTDQSIAELELKLDSLLGLVEGNRQLLLTPSGLRGK